MDKLSTNPVTATEPRKVVVNSKPDANAAVAEFCMGWTKVTTPMSPLVAAFSSKLEDSVNWKTPSGYTGIDSALCAFCHDPAASFALEERMRGMGWQWLMDQDNTWYVSAALPKTPHGEGTVARGDAMHSSRFIAMALAALSACGVEVELVEGWETR